MGQVERTKRWEMSDDFFPTIISKKPQDIGIGFEWEVQCDFYRDDLTPGEEDFEYGRECRLDRYSQVFAKRYGFKVHGECQATEFCSPIAYNLQTIKAVANKLKKRVAKDRLLEPYDPECAGIHVHTSVKGGVSKELYNKILLMLNRETSRDFVWSISGREEGRDYSEQAEVYGWDAEWDETNMTENNWFYAVDAAGGNCMLKWNWPSEERTIEYRIWNGTPDRLLVALEFAHACTKFAVQHKGENVPYLKDMKEWLFKQPGYKLLKTQHEWVSVR